MRTNIYGYGFSIFCLFFGTGLSVVGGAAMIAGFMPGIITALAGAGIVIFGIDDLVQTKQFRKKMK